MLEPVYIGPRRFAVGDRLTVITSDKENTKYTRARKHVYRLKRKYNAHGLWVDQFGIRECFTWQEAYELKLKEMGKWKK